MEKSLPWLFFILILFLLVLAACSQADRRTPTRLAPILSTPIQPASPSQSTAQLSIAPQSSSTPHLLVGEIRQEFLPSNLLKRDFYYYVYLPPTYESSGLAYPVVYLLHGRGDNMSAWARIPRDLEPLFASGELPPFIAVIPDFPSQSRAGYYIDSQYTGSDSPGEALESAFFKEIVPHIDRTYRTIPYREGRFVAGNSMGGYGAMRYLLAHPQVFFAAIALSPAVYTPLPPADSSTREFGAFGKGTLKFDETVYKALNYEALFPAFSTAGLKSYLFIAVGDDEAMHLDPQDAVHDLDFEAHVLYNKARRVQNLVSELRVYDGAHTWDVWRRGFLEGAAYLSRHLARPR